MQARGVIVRVRKGNYVFGPDYARRPYSRELLANLVYGPSYVSLDSALAAHGLIPEGVDALTSGCLGLPKSYDTPVGRFIYRPAPAKGFCVGVTRVALADGRAYLMATPGKALAGKLRETRGLAIRLLHGLDRFSEDLDFSLLAPDPSFDLARQVEGLREELVAFGFDLRVEVRGPAADSAFRSAFLKGGTREQMLVLSAGEELVRMSQRGVVSWRRGLPPWTWRRRVTRWPVLLRIQGRWMSGAMTSSVRR